MKKVFKDITYDQIFQILNEAGFGEVRIHDCLKKSEPEKITVITSEIRALYATNVDIESIITLACKDNLPDSIQGYIGEKSVRFVKNPIIHCRIENEDLGLRDGYCTHIYCSETKEILRYTAKFSAIDTVSDRPNKICREELEISVWYHLQKEKLHLDNITKVLKKNS